MLDHEASLAGAAHLDYAEDRAAAARALDTTATTEVTEPPTGGTFNIFVTVGVRHVAGPELDDEEVAQRLVEEVEALADMFIEAEGSDEESQYTATYD